jgi:hypothetical protein
MRHMLSTAALITKETGSVSQHMSEEPSTGRRTPMEPVVAVGS